MLTDLRGICCVGIGLICFGTLGVLDRHSESGSVVVGGAILMAAAIIANSIKSVCQVREEATPDEQPLVPRV